jgi:RNA polymerase sigma factor (sigma-70 family)
MGEKLKDIGRPWYWGKLGVANLSGSVARIWFTRNDELPPLPTYEAVEDYNDSLEAYERRELALKLLEVAELRRREAYVVARCIMHGQTYSEVARELGVTQERIRQIEVKAVRKLKTFLREKHELL